MLGGTAGVDAASGEAVSGEAVSGEAAEDPSAAARWIESAGQGD